MTEQVKKIVYITVQTPYSPGETFVLSEMVALKERGIDLLIIPRDNSKKSFNRKAARLIENTVSLPVLNFNMVWETFRYIMVHPISFLRILNNIAFKARNLKIAAKNIMIFPKGLYISKYLQNISVSHIHAHWASTTATMAYIVHAVTRIPWSFTAHQWDIPENNLLEEKCKSASFVRVIDAKGREEIMEIIQNPLVSKKISVIHMGVDMPKTDRSFHDPADGFTVLCPANLVLKKGHEYLIEAFETLLGKKVKLNCIVAGDGPLEDVLKTKVRQLGLNNRIEFLGRLIHERLFELYYSGQVNAVVLPSIITEDNEEEGIPVALMEAMAYGIPVISTNTGGIPELIGDGSGIMVEERDSGELAKAIEKLMEDKEYYHAVSKKGQAKIMKSFKLDSICTELLERFSMEV